MSGRMTNSALNVKIHGKLKNRITNEMYDRMTNLKSVSELAGFLKTETSWGKLLENVHTDSIHRGFLEQLLSRGVIRDVEELASFTSISTSAFIRLFSVREEIENLKVFIRLLFAGHPERYTGPPLGMRRGAIDFSELSKIKSFEELVGFLDGTVYAVPLRGFLAYGEKKYIFDIEMALDIYYREIFFKFAKRYLSEEEQKLVKEAYGSEADLMAILFIFRIKKNFDFPKEQIYFYTRQKYTHLRDEAVKKMVEAETAEAVCEILKETKYGEIFEESSIPLERRVDKYLQNMHRKLFRKAGYSIEAVLYYIKVREIELRNIITITEGIRYSMEPKMIQRYLITSIQSQ